MLHGIVSHAIHANTMINHDIIALNKIDWTLQNVSSKFAVVFLFSYNIIQGYIDFVLSQNV